MWLIYYDDFSNGWLIIDMVCFKDEDEAKRFFNLLSNTEEKWYHLKEIDNSQTRKNYLKVA